MPTKIKNRKAYRDYEIEEEYEAGIMLKGAEVKSIRAGRVSLKESYARVDDGEAWIIGMHIAPYDHSGYTTLNPTRKRKLLLHKHQIKHISRKTERAGYTLIPLKLYFDENNRVKILLGLGKGRTKYDKKQYLIEKDVERQKQRELSDWKKGRR